MPIAFGVVWEFALGVSLVLPKVAGCASMHPMGAGYGLWSTDYEQRF